MLLKFFIRTSGNLLFILGLGILLFTYSPIIYSEARFLLFPPQNYFTAEDISIISEDSSHGISDVGPDYSSITQFQPIDPSFGIVIGKIDVNAPVVPNVTTVNESEYMDALKLGVAHARGTALPGEPGNMFFFAHSSLNFWQLGPYATVFNLLNKLEDGDVITVFYEGQVYNYAVYEAFVVPGWNTEPFTDEYDEPILTLITCDPPGSTVNRRVVRARLL